MSLFRVGLAVAAVLLAVGVARSDGPVAAPADAAKLIEALKSSDQPARLDAAMQARAVQDEKLLAPLVAALDDVDVGVRSAATLALAARTAPEAKKKAAAALNPRLAKLARKGDADAELIGTAQALGTLAQPSSVEPLTADIGNETGIDVVSARLMAVANVPCAEAVEALIQFLSKNGRGQNGKQHQACRVALRSATGEDLGADPDLWRAWWREAKRDFDFEGAAHRREAEREKKERPKKGKKEK